MLAIPLTAVLVLHTGAAGMALLAAVGSLPALFLSIHAGALIDRRGDRRRTMIAADLFRAGLLATIPAAYLLHSLTLPFLLAVSCLAGAAGVLFRVASSALFVSLVRDNQYVEANALLGTAQAGAFLVGPALGGVLLQLILAPFVIVADSVSFLASALSLAAIRPIEPARASEPRPNVLAGFRFIWESAVLRPTLWAQVHLTLFQSAFMALYLLYGTDVLHVTPAQWGLILGPSSVGALAASLWGRRLVAWAGLGPMLLASVALTALPELIVPWAHGTHGVVVAWLFGAEGLVAAGAVLRVITTGSIRALAIPNPVRARTNSVFELAGTGLRPVGALLALVASALWGLHTTMWVAAVGESLALLWIAGPSMVRRREAGDFRLMGDAEATG